MISILKVKLISISPYRFILTIQHSHLPTINAHNTTLKPIIMHLSNKNHSSQLKQKDMRIHKSMIPKKQTKNSINMKAIQIQSWSTQKMKEIIVISPSWLKSISKNQNQIKKRKMFLSKWKESKPKRNNCLSFIKRDALRNWNPDLKGNP